jgi:hypothetical protein
MLKSELCSFIAGKNALLAFGDPGGAKQVLALANRCKGYLQSIKAVSDKKRDFYEDFGIAVDDFYIQSSRGWFEKIKPDLLIIGTSIPIGCEFDLLLESIRCDVRSIAFIDHWTNFAARFECNGLHIFPDKICVIDERARNLAILEGVPSNKILVVGNPHYQYLEQWRPNISREKFLARLEMPAHEKYILYAPEPLSSFGLEKKYGFTELDGIKKIQKAVEGHVNSRIHVVIKGHPNQLHDIFYEYINDNPQFRVKYFADEDINLLSYYSEAVLGFFSNSLIEAKFIGKPVIRLLMMLKEGVSDHLANFTSSKFIICNSDFELSDAIFSIENSAYK